jgi:hypothetical protein
MRTWIGLLLTSLLLTGPNFASATDFVGEKKFVVLRAQAHDATATTYTASDVQTQFDNITNSWGPHSSYGKIQPKFEISSLITLPGNFADYIDKGDSSSDAAFYKTVGDAVTNAPSGLDWSNLQGVVVFLADTRSGGFTRGVTYSGVTVHAPGGDITVHASLVTEDPSEGLPTSWGRVAHEVGHAMQQAGHPHPSDYASSFEQMDGEYPAQTGVFEKEADKAYPGWLPPGKYINVSPPIGTASTIWAQENDPTGQPDAQALKAFPAFGGTAVYYLVSVRRRLLGDDLDTEGPTPPTGDCDTVATPHGIPDCGVLIERVVEGGDPNLKDCDPAGSSNCVNRWVHVMGKGGDGNKLWQEGDVFSSATYGDLSSKTDAISIIVRKKDDSDHYTVDVQYNRDNLDHPDVGINDWLRPPGNTYETTDIWVDSPVNGYANPSTDPASYRYGVWSDGMGGIVPIGNGDDPAIGQMNRLYARVRNYGTQVATNVTVHFDVTDPLGLGISGSNGFKQIGTVDSSAFPGLASIAPGASVDVYIEWTPNVALTADELAAGRFYLHSCVRVRIDAVPGETFLANQDGDGEQENIEYFDATSSSPGSPGSPGAPNKAVVHLKNDSMSATKTFSLALLRDTLPASWKVEVNGGTPLVTLPPGGSKDIPVVVQQTAHEAIGARHQVRLIASSQITLTSALHKTPHSEVHPLSGVTFEVGVLRKTELSCVATKGGVTGVLKGFGTDTKESRPRVYLVQIQERGKRIIFARQGGRTAEVMTHNGRFIFRDVPKGRGAVCLYAGSRDDTSAASKPFIE